MHFEHEAKIAEAQNKLDNALVRQKDAILFEINNGEYSKAQMHLDLVRDLWNACNYGYKVLEIQKRITEKN